MILEVLVPKENVNDEEVIIIGIFFAPGSEVKEGDLLFNIETSKVNIDIEAPIGGIIQHDLEEGTSVEVGSLLCKIASEEDLPNQVSTVKKEKGKKADSKVKISKEARKLAEKLNVDISVFKEGMVSKKDIKELAKKDTKKPYKMKLPKIKPNSLIILGGGGHAKMCIDILKQTEEFSIVGIVDEKLPLDTEVLGIKVIGDESILEDLNSKGINLAVNGIGSVTNPNIRKKAFNKLKNMGFTLPKLIHPSAIVEPSARIGEGCQIMMGACVGSDVTVKENCIINSNSVISHDSLINSHSQISPGAILAGQVTVDELAIIGMGVTIYIGVKIGKNSVIQNGLDVFNDIDPGTILESK